MSNTYNWTLIERNADLFANRWATESDETGEAKTFWDELFQIFALRRYDYARFEGRVKRKDNSQGFMDLFWRGKMLVEHKSAYKSSDKEFEKAYQQALLYVEGLKPEDKPKRIVICNFQHFRIYKSDAGFKPASDSPYEEFDLKDLPQHIRKFQFILEYSQQLVKEEEEANIQAAEIMGALHDAIEQHGYKGHDLEWLLVRILFCLFAEDTGIFKDDLFKTYVLKHTEFDGSDLGERLLELFVILNTPENKRPKETPQYLNDFPYVNGSLFSKHINQPPKFTVGTRGALHKCCNFGWSKISPAIFGSLFQSVMNPVERRNLGAHYTSEVNIKRLINPLFMDSLWAEFEKVKDNQKKLEQFLFKVAALKFLDPACGSGNFLVVTYKELRLLELEILKTLIYKHFKVTVGITFSVRSLVKMTVSNFYGIEYEESSALIAQVAMWLAEHQMNTKLGEEFGDYMPMIPLDESATILNANALQTDWATAFPSKVDFIIGNPPFIGYYLQNKQQKDDVALITKGIDGAGVLDYVAMWHLTAAKYMKAYPSVKTGFVSTNSIAQGEQVGVLWKELFDNYKVQIVFAHQTFKWSNEAKGVAAVHCVIIGFVDGQNTEGGKKYLFEYEDIKGEPHKVEVKNISPYLTDGKNIYVERRQTPISNAPELLKGSQPTDGGNFLLSDSDKDEMLQRNSLTAKFIKPFLGAQEFLNGKTKWCLWLTDISPREIQELSDIKKRVEAVRKMRLASTKASTIKWADKPTLFTENRQPTSDFVLIPRVSSENRSYIPMGFFSKDYIIGDTCISVPNADLFLFGNLTSKMHMAWVKYTCGRLKSDYRYSNTIVYNNYPFPQSVSDSQKAKVEAAAQDVLDIRLIYTATGSSLADLYDPLSMPPDLLKAHSVLDKAVDNCYGKTTFATDAKRVEFLFDLYDVFTKTIKK
jgi:N-6 DNA Methylase